MVDSKFLLTEISNELLVPMLCWKVPNKLSFESAWLHGSSSKLCFPHLLVKNTFLCAMILRQAIHLSKVISGRSTYLSASTFTRSDYDLRAASYINISLANRPWGCLYHPHLEIFWVYYCLLLFFAMAKVRNEKHCQRRYRPRRWLLWPVILVW